MLMATNEFPAIGLRFDIEKLEKLPVQDGYDFPAWAIIWRHVNAASLTRATLYGGDSLRRGENVYIVAIQCLYPNQIQMIRNALVRANDFWRVAAPLPFVEGQELEGEPLVEYGVLDHGRWVGEHSTARRALDHVLGNSIALDQADLDTYLAGKNALEAQFAINAGKIRVFLSYSRKDQFFVDWLHGALKAANIEVLRDVADTLVGEEWWRRLKQLIADADTVVFVVSPRSVASPTCADEVAYAQGLNKRVFPAILEEVDWQTVPGGLRQAHGLYFINEADRAKVLEQLVASLMTDASWLREHTRLLARAQDWWAMDRTDAELLRGRALAAAEQWLAMKPQAADGPPSFLTDYISASRIAEQSTYNAKGNSSLLRQMEAALNTLTEEKLAQLFMAMGQRDAGLASYRRLLERVGNAMVSDGAGDAQKTMVAIVFEWVLASYGDMPLARYERIIESLKRLKAEEKLNKDQERLLPEAEKKLAGLQRYGIPG